jgi:ABC-type branched-subunit amino acid transport system substrate-binding protein
MLPIKLVLFFCIAMISNNALTKDVEQGVYSDRIHFGQTVAIKGPAQALGLGMKNGIMAAFSEINAAGGVNGRKLLLTTYDDGYEPLVAVENAKKLIEDDKVFALIGGVGTPTAKVIEPITSAAKIPFIAPFYGAELITHPFKSYVLNVRRSYWQETEEWIERLTTDLGVKRVAIFYQEDSYGQAGLIG